tara:strand:+ start:684 stop:1391 length:708 start_codon:yes stop_codon:yes gene_type:complete
MRVSLSEIQTFITKACVATRLPLGLAEDAGHAARHAIQRGSGQLEAFVEAIEAMAQNRSVTYDIDKAIMGHFVPHDSDKNLSALHAGPSACDFIFLNETQNVKQGHITLISIDVPAVVIYQASVVSENVDSKYSLSWHISGASILHGICWQGSLLFTEGTLADLLSSHSSEISLQLVELGDPLDKSTSKFVDQVNSPQVEERVWNNILKYAGRSLVETTETSRLTGAGAGVLDTD